VKRKRKDEGGVERGVVVLSGEVEFVLVESQSWAGAAAKLRQKTSALPGGVRHLGDWVPTKYLECRTLQIQLKAHLCVRRRAADGSRYKYWPWAANGRLLHRGLAFCTASIVLHKAELGPEAEVFGAPGVKTLAREWGRR
jgi:hypothetical protein